MGIKRSIKNVTKDGEEKLSVPPGFASLTSFSLNTTVAGQDISDPMASDGRSTSGPLGSLLSNSDIEKFKTSFSKRPWIISEQFDRVPQRYRSEHNDLDMKCPASARLPKGVIWGCANGHNSVKVTARWHPAESHLPALDDAPVFYPTEEEFKDSLKYIAKIRPKAEDYGICRIVPPPSWLPPCLLEDKRTWETAIFGTRVQQIDGLQNLYLKRKLSRLHDKLKNATQNVAANMDLDPGNEVMSNSEELNCTAASSEFESGPEVTFKSFRQYACDFSRQYFNLNNKVIDADLSLITEQREPLVARIEGEYWRIIENPSEEIEVLCGNLGSKTLGSGFPVKDSPTDVADYSEFVESQWNLNNIPKLSASLLPYGCYDTSSILLPQLFVGMCFASQCWRNEDHHLYSLCYMHFGDPKVWYSVPGRYYFKFVEVVKKLFPELSKHPELLKDLATQLSPSMLISEGIPVYRCVQNPFEFVLIFPGAYHSQVSCGFNCSEEVCFAPFDWLPHGQNIVELYTGYCLKTSISHDKLLLGVAMEAVSKQWESLTIQKNSFDSHPWNNVCGKDGMLTKLLKSRVKIEGIRREYLCSPSVSRTLDEVGIATKRECSTCFYDLYLSGVGCSCSPGRYSCLRHMKELCSCAWGAKYFFFRYTMTELDLLVAALEGNLKATHCWAKRKATGEQKNPNITTPKSSNGSSYELNEIASSKNVVPPKTSSGAYEEQKTSGEEIVILLSDDED